MTNLRYIATQHFFPPSLSQVSTTPAEPWCPLPKNTSLFCLTSLSLPANMQQSMETYTSSKGRGRETWVWRFRKKVKCFHVYSKVLCEHNILLIQIKLGHLISQGWDGWREKTCFFSLRWRGPQDWTARRKSNEERPVFVNNLEFANALSIHKWLSDFF